MGTNHFINLHLWFKFYRCHPTSVCVLCKFPGGSGCSLRRRGPLSMHLHLVMDVSITSCRCGWRLILRGKQRQAVAGRAVGMLWLRWMSPEECLEPNLGNRDPKRSSQMDNGTMFPCPATRVSFRCCWQHPGLKVRWTWPSLWWDLLKNLTLMFVFEHLQLLTAASSLPLSWKLPEGTDCLWASVNGRVQKKTGMSTYPAPVSQQVTLLPYRMCLPASSHPGLFPDFAFHTMLIHALRAFFYSAM